MHSAQETFQHHFQFKKVRALYTIKYGFSSQQQQPTGRMLISSSKGQGFESCHCRWHWERENNYRILSSIMCIQVPCAPEFHNDFWQKELFLLIKNNLTRINRCKFIHYKSHLKPFLSYLPFIVRRKDFSSIVHVKNVRTILYKMWFFLSAAAAAQW
jgi:hypothetical protein